MEQDDKLVTETVAEAASDAVETQDVHKQKRLRDNAI